MDTLMTIPDIPASQLIKKLLIYFGILLVIAYALFLRARRWRLMLQAQMQRSEAFTRLMEKFGSTKEFLDFLRTDQGQQFLQDPILLRGHPFSRVLSFVQWGVVVLAVGITMMLTVPTDDGELRLLAIAATSLGVGLLVVALVTFYLARRWEMLPPKANPKSPAGM